MCLVDLAKVNRRTLAHGPTLDFLDRVVSGALPADRPLAIVDVGSGYGDLPRKIACWARQRGVAVSLTGVDLNPWSARAAAEPTPPCPPIAWVTADAFAYVPPGGIDVVVSSLFTHHLSDPRVARFLAWMTAAPGSAGSSTTCIPTRSPTTSSATGRGWPAGTASSSTTVRCRSRAPSGWRTPPESCLAIAASTTSTWPPPEPTRDIVVRPFEGPELRDMRSAPPRRGGRILARQRRGGLARARRGGLAQATGPDSMSSCTLRMRASGVKGFSRNAALAGSPRRARASPA